MKHNLDYLYYILILIFFIATSYYRSGIQGVIETIIIFAIIVGFIYIIDIKTSKDSEKSLAKYYAERNEYEKFLKNNDFDEYNKDLSKEDKYIKELELCNKFLQENPKNEHVLERKAMLCFELGKHKESLAIYEMLSNKQTLLYNRERARCYAALGDKKTALEIIDGYFEIVGGKDMHYYENAVIYKILKEYDNALKNYTLAIKIKPEFYYYEDRAEIYKILGELDKSEADFKKYEELRDKYVEKINKEREKESNKNNKKDKFLNNNFKSLKP